jgi:hypothetical protein
MCTNKSKRKNQRKEQKRNHKILQKENVKSSFVNFRKSNEKKCYNLKHAPQKTLTTSLKCNIFYVQDKSISSIKIPLKTLFKMIVAFKISLTSKK